MSNVTLITILNDDEVSQPILSDNTHKDDLDRETLSDSIIDLSLDLPIRINALNTYYKIFNEEETLELINRLVGMYTFSGTKILEKYIYEISINSEISTFLKITTAKSLCYFNKNTEFGFIALNKICQYMKNVATPCQIDAVCLLMHCDKFKIEARSYFCFIINNQDLDCDYRYKTILSLENKNIVLAQYFIKESIFEFFKTKNRTLYRILAGQYLMQKLELSDDEKKQVENILIEFSQDPDLDYDLRADSADVILRLGSEEHKVTARKIIMMLGRQDGNVKTIFDNAQNVHVDEIEKSVLEALEFLSSIDLQTISSDPNSPTITFDYVKKQIDMLIENESKSIKKGDKNNKTTEEKEYDDKVDKINVSLNRILLDRALYSKYNCSLSHILLKVWTYLSSHKEVEQMKNRLLEELVDMSGTCSSGFASRLVNVISGFGEFNLRISWRDQIIANFNGRLNARARLITDKKCKRKNFDLYCKVQSTNNDIEHDTIRQDEIKKVKKNRKSMEKQLEEFQGNVLEEMTVDNNDFASRKNFLKFFRKNMLSIRQELYEEFKPHIDDASFDLYFRAAISTYESGGYV